MPYSVSLTTGSTLNPDAQLGNFGQPIEDKKVGYRVPHYGPVWVPIAFRGATPAFASINRCEISSKNLRSAKLVLISSMLRQIITVDGVMAAYI